ncbi:hypothetical protein KJ786_02195 [Patescibacteria group bacterium]|nr:hypothetical protein [Patescibacteria group bacterium]
MKKILLFLILFATLSSFIVKADFVSAQQVRPEITLFYSSTCPNCVKEEEFLKDLIIRYPEIDLKEYEVMQSQDNQKLLGEFYQKYNVPKNEQGFVPATFTAARYFIGFNEQIGKDIENCLEECIGHGSVIYQQKVKVPFFGEIDLARLSLPTLTIVLGTLDGFNPCAMWVLVILVSLLLSLKSRKKIALVGGTFIFAEGLLYFLFMAAWLNAFIALSYTYLVRILVGIFGIIFGVWRIRDFINWKPGVCKVVKNVKSQAKLMDKIKNVLKPSAVPATILGVVGLAFSVNLVEFFCSAGFPTIYTRILSLQGLSSLQYYLWLVFYNIFYMLDDFIVFGVAFFTMSRYNFSDKYNRWSTLIAGLLILILGILLILRPELLMFA